LDLIGLLVTLLILAIVAYVVFLIIGMLHIPPPILTIVYLIVGLIFLVILLDKTGIYHVALK
jgi:hypothetical protein